MPRLVLDYWRDGAWTPLNSHVPSDQPGSLSDNPPGGERRIILFGCGPEYSVIVESVGGTDVTVGAGRLAVVKNYTRLATLGPGEEYTVTVRPDELRGREVRVRFRHEEG